MKYGLKNGRQVEIRLLNGNDNEKLFEYFDKHLSRESKSRFGPHLFDKETTDTICQNPNEEITRYVAIDDEKNIVAYVLIKQGMIEWDLNRYATRQQSYDHNTFSDFCPFGRRCLAKYRTRFLNE